mmetsp:Transcript_46249/g.100550  ORF Transcript_46249/g.100550 Transcript_46249/m.100550 type:complete len:205 (-) Transcript_46249:361-975(-)
MTLVLGTGPRFSHRLADWRLSSSSERNKNASCHQDSRIGILVQQLEHLQGEGIKVPVNFSRLALEESHRACEFGLIDVAEQVVCRLPSFHLVPRGRQDLKIIVPEIYALRFECEVLQCLFFCTKGIHLVAIAAAFHPVDDVRRRREDVPHPAALFLAILDLSKSPRVERLLLRRVAPEVAMLYTELPEASSLSRSLSQGLWRVA